MFGSVLGPGLHADSDLDLAVERRRLAARIDRLAGLAERWQREGADAQRVDAAALRLQSCCTSVERCLLQIVRLLNGGTPEGADWHSRLLDSLALATEHRPALLSSDTARALGLLLGFRHVVRHLYADDLDPAQVQQRLSGALMLWPQLCADLQAFDHWLQELIALAESDHPSG